MTDYLTDEMVEKAATALADDWNPERGPVLAAMFRDYAQTALSAVLPGIIRQAKAEGWDEGYTAGHEDARAVQPTYPQPTHNPHEQGGQP